MSNKWISVKDKMPNDREFVLVITESKLYFVASHQYVTGGVDYWNTLPGSNIFLNPTHWQQLPEMPKENK